MKTLSISSKAQIYLRNTDFWERKIPEKDLQIMLVASCLRCIGNLTDISFVLEVGRAIRKKYRKNLNAQLLKALDLLADLEAPFQKKTLDRETIEFVLSDVQQLLQPKDVSTSL